MNLLKLYVLALTLSCVACASQEPAAKEPAPCDKSVAVDTVSIPADILDECRRLFFYSMLITFVI